MNNIIGERGDVFLQGVQAGCAGLGFMQLGLASAIGHGANPS